MEKRESRRPHKPKVAGSIPARATRPTSLPPARSLASASALGSEGEGGVESSGPLLETPREAPTHGREMAKSSEPGQTAVDRWLAPILAAERELDERERLFPA